MFFKHGFSWSSVNYAPLVTIGVMLGVTIWYLVSARTYVQGTDPHDRLPEVGAAIAATSRAAPRVQR